MESTIMLEPRRRKRKGRSAVHVLISTCMWLVLVILVTNRSGLLPPILQEMVGKLILTNILWFVLGLTALGVVLTCVDIETLKKEQGWWSTMEILRSLLLIVAALDLLFLCVLR